MSLNFHYLKILIYFETRLSVSAFDHPLYVIFQLRYLFHITVKFLQLPKKICLGEFEYKQHNEFRYFFVPIPVRNWYFCSDIFKPCERYEYELKQFLLISINTYCQFRRPFTLINLSSKCIFCQYPGCSVVYFNCLLNKDILKLRIVKVEISVLIFYFLLEII